MKSQSDANINRKTVKRIILPVFLFLLLWAAVLPYGKNVQAASRGWKISGNTAYYYKADGTLQKGWLSLNGKKYFFNTRNGRQVLGYQKSSKGYRFFYNRPGAGGYMATGFVKDSSGNIRYFNTKTGLMHTGWQTSKGRSRYYNPANGVMLVGVRKVSGKYYYFVPARKMGASGYAYKGGWITIRGKKYYFDPKTGQAYTGWKTINGAKHYFSSDGRPYTGLRRVGSHFYFFRGLIGAVYQGGLYNAGSITYYFDKKDGHRVTGWVTENGKSYYFGSDGKALKNTTKVIGGTTYSFDQNGVAVDTSSSSSVSSTGAYPYKLNNASNDQYVSVYDKKNGRTYYLAKEFASHPGVADGTKTDRDLLAAICDAEAGDGDLQDMEAVCMCVLNCTIDKNKDFPSVIRYVIYQVMLVNNKVCALQYSPVQGGALLARLNGRFSNKAVAYQAADEALRVFNAHITTGAPRTIPGRDTYNRKDFNFMFFMTERAFWSQNLNFDKVDYYVSKNGHVFFVDWV